MQTEKTLNLVERLKKLVAEERRITKEILILLNEVEEQRIYAEMGYPSLFQFCTEYLGYSEGAAGRRVNAARLLRKNPEQVVAKIESGELSISTASRIQHYLKKEKKSVAEVQGLVEELSRKSQREVERILVAKAPEALARESLRPKTATHSELRLNISRDCEAKFEKLRAHFSHKNMSMGELFEKLVYEELERVEKKKFGRNGQEKFQLPDQKKVQAEVSAQSVQNEVRRERTSPAEWSQNPAKSNSSEAEQRKNELTPHPKQAPEKTTSTPEIPCKKPWQFEYTNLRRSLPKQTQRHVYQAAKGQCQYVSPITHQRCQSKFLLQIEHKIPLAKNGTNTRANLELLCRAHNLLKKEKEFPRRK